MLTDAGVAQELAATLARAPSRRRCPRDRHAGAARRPGRGVGARVAAGRRGARRAQGRGGRVGAAGGGADGGARTAHRRRGAGAGCVGRPAARAGRPVAGRSGGGRHLAPGGGPLTGRGVARRAEAGRDAAHGRADRAAGPAAVAVGSRTLARPPAEAAPGDERVLRRIRGLLAKAESTEFPEEAESLTGKAQELMTRHAVDAALLARTARPADGVATRRVHVADPYVRAKMQLLAAVAEANDVRLVWYQRWASPTWSAAGRPRRGGAAVHVAAATGGAGAGRRGTAGGTTLGDPDLPPGVPARLRAADRGAAAGRPQPRHRRGGSRARSRPAAGVAVAPRGGRLGARRAVPTGADEPQPIIGGRRRLVRRAGRGGASRRRTAPVVTALRTHASAEARATR